MSHATRHKAAVDKFKKLLLTSDESSLGLAAVDESDFGGEVAQAKRNSLIDLPVPAVSVVADYDTFTAGGYVQPRAFIRRLPVARPELLALTADGGERARSARARARAPPRARPPPTLVSPARQRRRPSFTLHLAGGSSVRADGALDEAVVSGLDHAADAEDAVWLAARAGKDGLTARGLEWIIDRLEWCVVRARARPPPPRRPLPASARHRARASPPARLIFAGTRRQPAA